MSDIPLATATQLKSPAFAADNSDLYDAYVELKVRGYNSSISLSKVFGSDYMNTQTGNLVIALESNPYYITKFAARLEAIKISDLWNTKVSLNELLQLVRSPFASDNVRLNAQKELNIMVGIIVVDEFGKTKAGRSLADFYTDAAKQTLPPAPPAQDPK